MDKVTVHIDYRDGVYSATEVQPDQQWRHTAEIPREVFEAWKQFCSAYRAWDQFWTSVDNEIYRKQGGEL